MITISWGRLLTHVVRAVGITPEDLYKIWHLDTIEVRADANTIEEVTHKDYIESIIYWVKIPIQE